MDKKLLEEMIEFLDWVEQWYYSPASLTRIREMRKKIIAALQFSDAMPPASEVQNEQSKSIMAGR